MKKLLTLLLIIYYLPLIAQDKYKISGIFENGKIIGQNEALFLNDSCTFRVIDSEGTIQFFSTCEWEFNIEHFEENEYSFIKKKLTHPYFGIKIDSVLYKNSSLCKQFKRYTYENDRSIYYKGYIKCKGNLFNGEEINLELPFWVNLLPERALIKILNINWGIYDENYQCYDDANMIIQIISERTDKILVVKPAYFTTFYFYPDIDPINNIGTLDFFEDDAYFVFRSSNENGTVESSDTLSIPRLSSISTPEIDKRDIHFYPNPVKDILYIKGDDSIYSFSIYTLKGDYLFSIHDCISFVDLTALLKGEYLLLYKNKKTKEEGHIKIVKI